MLIDHDDPEVRTPAAEPLLFRLVMLVLVLCAFWAIYVLFARNVPKIMARGLDAGTSLYLVSALGSIAVPLLGAFGLWTKKERLRKILLVWLPLEAFFGGRRFARGYTGLRQADSESFVYAWVFFGCFWMLVFMYLIHPKVRLLFKPEPATTGDRSRNRRRHLLAGRRPRRSVGRRKRSEPEEPNGTPSEAPTADAPPDEERAAGDKEAGDDKND